MSLSISRSLFTYCLISSCGLFTFNSAVFAQIVPDKTTATQVNGNAIAPVGAGTVNGGNLYHSFDKLNVPNSGVVFNTGNSTVDGNKINNILNRVTGDTPSQVLGTIESRTAFPNANVFLMNPNGVVFGKDAKLEIGGSFHVNTGTGLGFSGDRTFSVDKASLEFPSGNPQNIKFGISQPAAIINQANLSVIEGKNISFTAGAVVNSGVLTAPSGNIALTSVSGGSVVDLRSPDLVLGLSVVKDAVPVNWNGAISSLPKLAELLTGKAQQGDRVVVKPDGSLAIVTTAASNELPVTNGTTVASGNINVSSTTSQGGNVGIFGDRVALVNSQITANSGNVLIGGDFQGKGVVPNAQFTYFDNKSIVDVSALTNGNGGRVIVWGDRTTQFLGKILSKGGLISGNGGFVEVSGKENLSYLGNVDTSATNGSFGTLLLDPTNITIVDTGAADNNQLSAGVPNAVDPAFTIFFDDVAPASFTISNTALNAATSNIILQATNDIIVNAPVNIAAPNISFTAQAGNNIGVSANITTNNGDVVLNSDRDGLNGGLIFIGGSIGNPTVISTNGGDITLGGGANPLVNPAIGSSTDPFSAYGIGVALSSLNAGNATNGGGNISLIGQGNPTSGGIAPGIRLDRSSLLTTGAGTINLVGIGREGSLAQDFGVVFTEFGSNTIQTVDGNISITGNGGNGGNNSVGVLFGRVNTVRSTGNGSITILGTGGNGGAGNQGVATADIAILETNNGNITITGIGQGTAQSNTGISLTGATIAILGNGNITLNGTGGNGTDGNRGVDLFGGGISINNGNLRITGTGRGSTFANDGIAQNSASGIGSLISGTGNIDYIGFGSPNGTSGNNGLRLDSTSLQTNIGNINLTGTGQTNNSNPGINFIATQTVRSNGGGNIVVTADQIRLASPGLIFRGTGNLTLQPLTPTVGFTLGTPNPDNGLEFNNFSGKIQNTFNNIFIGRSDGSGSINFAADSPFGADTVFNSPVTLRALNPNATINTNGFNITGIDNATITLLANGNINASSITNLGRNVTLTSINGNISTATGTINTSSNSGNGGNIVLNATNGNLATGNLNASTTSGSSTSTAGGIALNAQNLAIGGDLNLASTSGIGGNLTLAGNLPLIANATFSTSGLASSGNIDLANATVTGSQALTLNAGSGNISLGAIGTSSIPLNGLTLTSGNITLNKDIFVNAINPLTFGSPVTLGNDVAITSSNGITFGSTVNGNQALNLNAGSNSIFFNGVVGGISPLASLLTNTSSPITSTGAVDIRTLGNITTGNITNNGRDIAIASTNGNVAIASINATSTSGNGGNVNVQSSGNFTTTGNFTSDGINFFAIATNTTTTGNGGNISLVSNTEAINISSGDIQSAANNGNAGNITIQAANSINTAGIFATTVTNGNGGAISLNSTNGGITSSTSRIDSGATNGNAGSLTLKALADIIVNDIGSSTSNGIGGLVTFQSGGDILFNRISSRNRSGTGTSGNIDLQAVGNITSTGNINIGGQDFSIISANSGTGNGGDISLISDSINTSSASVSSSTIVGNAGNITFQAANSIVTADLLANATSKGDGRAISITSTNGTVATGDINTSAVNGKGGNVTIQSNGDIGTLNISTSNLILLNGTNSNDINSGDISLTSTSGNITIGALDTSTRGRVETGSSEIVNLITFTGKSGNVDIQASGDISIGNLSADTEDGYYIFPKTIQVTTQEGNPPVAVTVDQIVDFSQVYYQGSRGSISLTSTNGNVIGGDIVGDQVIVNVPIGSVTTGAVNVNVLSIQATNSINTSDIYSGLTSLTSTNGTVNTGFLINTDLTIKASDSINISNISGFGFDGQISLTSTNGNVSIGYLNGYNNIGTAYIPFNGGNVTIQAKGDIKTTGNVTLNGIDYAIATFTDSGNGGNISLISDTGAINVSSGRVNTASTSGTSGSITFKAAGDIITGAGTTPNPAIASFVSTGGTGTPSSISFTSTNGAINTSLGDIDAGGGAIAFTAKNNITTSGVFSRAVNGGAIALTSQTGAIDTSAGDLTTTTTNTGTGGNITLAANNNVTTRGVFATGDNGKILITSTNGGIDTTLGLSSLASIGSNNNITLTALQNIVTRDIFAQGNQTALSITSTTGTVDTRLGTIQAGIATSQNGNSGNINISASGDILAAAINAPNLNLDLGGNAGSVSLTSNTGSISFTGISTRQAAATDGSGNGGAINLQANGNITSTGVVSIGGAPSIYSLISGVFGGFAGNGGAISLTSTNGSIDTRSGTVGTSAISGNGGAISFTSQTGAIATGDLTTSSNNNGGVITIDASTKINVGRVDSRGSIGNGGNVTLDPIGDVIFTAINATGGSTSGNGGDIKIVSTGGNVLGTGISFATFGSCGGSTICTNGTGTVSIQHGITSPFDLNSFLVGGADTNGTVGTIVAGGAPISLTPVPNGAGFFTQGNISISPGQGIFIPPTTTIPTTTTPTPTDTRTTTTLSTPINPIIIASTPPVVVTSTRTPSVDISNIANKKAGEYMAAGRFEDAFNEMEKGHISEFENFLGEALTPQIKNIEQLQVELDDISKRTGSATTVVYPIILNDRLELLIIPPKGTGKPFREFVSNAKESAITPIIQDFANNVRDPSSQDYLEQSQKLYDWLVRPYSDRLETLQKNNQTNNPQPSIKQEGAKPNVPAEKLPSTLIFVMDGGLRVIPVAALHDGKQFLVEKYALANLPYLRATRLESRDRRLNNILAMGLTESVQGFSALPSVKIEVSTISSKVFGGDGYLDKDFTVSNLQEKRRQGNFGVLHLATHAQFISSNSQGSFIQFWDERLSVDRIPSLRFDSPLIEMLTLSACQTAVGQNLGLGGLSVSSGARSVLASLWEVSDTGTAPLMIQFYNSFPEDITKAIALQRAQVDILQGKVTIKDGKIVGIPKLPSIPLSQANQGDINLTHPFFWSSFILIGNWL